VVSRLLPRPRARNHRSDASGTPESNHLSHFRRIVLATRPPRRARRRGRVFCRGRQRRSWVAGPQQPLGSPAPGFRGIAPGGASPARSGPLQTLCRQVTPSLYAPPTPSTRRYDSLLWPTPPASGPILESTLDGGGLPHQPRITPQLAPTARAVIDGAPPRRRIDRRGAAMASQIGHRSTSGRRKCLGSATEPSTAHGVPSAAIGTTRRSEGVASHGEGHLPRPPGRQTKRRRRPETPPANGNGPAMREHPKQVCGARPLAGSAQTRGRAQRPPNRLSEVAALVKLRQLTEPLGGVGTAGRCLRDVRYATTSTIVAIASSTPPAVNTATSRRLREADGCFGQSGSGTTVTSRARPSDQTGLAWAQRRPAPYLPHSVAGPRMREFADDQQSATASSRPEPS
jgi:hypothetical protein